MKTEQQTPVELIDKLLLQAGWSVNDPSQVVEEFDILVGLPEGVQEPRTSYEGHQFSDYVLLGKDGWPIAVVEAKKTSRDVTGSMMVKSCFLSAWMEQQRLTGAPIKNEAE